MLTNIDGLENKMNYNGWVKEGEKNEIFEILFQDVDKKIEVHETFHMNENFEKSADTVHIQITGESYFSDPNKFDINFIPVEKESQNVIIFPFAAWIYWIYINASYFDKTMLLQQRQLNKNKTKFCLFSSSHDKCKARNDFFADLSKYKQVDSCGRYMNNMECLGSWGSKEYIDFIGNYKFMICFENLTQPNYFTEKLINAYSGGAIPIYWGCPNISDYVNMDAILYLKPNYTEEDWNKLIEEIKYLDENEDAYRAKYESIFFKDGKLPDAFNPESLRQKINDRLI